MLVQTRFECRRSVVWVRRAVAKATGCDGVNVWQNNGPSANQVVFHLHVHVLPRYEGDDVAAQIAARRNLSEEESNEMVAKIQAALAEDEEPAQAKL